MSILELNNIYYSYQTGKTKRDVLKDITVSFERGKVYAIIGKSGNGKTTLLSLMAGLDLPDKGDVIFEGQNTREMDLNEYRRTKVSIIYQDFALFPLLTACENVMYPMELCHIDKESQIKTAKELINKVGLPETVEDRYPSKLSGGEQQRVAIARALTMGKELLLADEPTGNLDSGNSEEVMKLLVSLAHNENRCIIIVTHDLSVVEKSDIVYKIEDGKILSMPKIR